MYYLLVVAAVILFSLQFLFNQRFQQSRGESLKSALEFSLYKSAVIVVIMLFIGKFSVQITLFSVIMAALYAVSGIAMTAFSLKAFAVANLSVYSVFSMLGGMLLPFVLGIGFYNEELTLFKLLCCALIVVSVLLNIKKGKQDKKAVAYYMAVFVLNGMAGVLSKIHQSSSLPHTDSTGFMLISSFITAIICAVWLLVTYKEIPLIKGKNLLYTAGYGVFNGIGNLFLLISLSNLPASVQYPLVTGGVMICSTAISALRKEKITAKEYFAAAVSFVASVFMAF